ncbi:MAG: right-handed parallel beta-helix repeat-containing protein [Candidatus Thorarchaeota archaeon]
MGRVKVVALLILFITALNSTGLASSNSFLIHHKEIRRFTVSQTEGLIEHLPVIISDNSDFSQLGFPGIGTYEHPYIIEGLSIVNNDRCIAIANTDSHFRIQNCDLLGTAMDGVIRLENTTNGIIEDCCIEGGDLGIYMDHCASIDILNNAIAGAIGAGICVLNSDYDITMSDNRVFNSQTGIYMDQADSCIIARNRVYHNIFGIFLSYGSQNQINQNSIGWNIGDDGSGVVIERNAYDGGSDNNWNDNSWTDFRSYETWYPISGPALAQDNNPTGLYDIRAPIITVSGSSNVVQGNSSAVLKWTFVETFPTSFRMYQNGVISEEGYLLSDVITTPLGLLSAGQYNFTLLIQDCVGYVESLQYHISVVSTPDLDDPFLLSMIICMGIVASIIVILPLDYRRRKRKYLKTDEVENEMEEEKEFDISELLE